MRQVPRIDTFLIVAFLAAAAAFASIPGCAEARREKDNAPAAREENVNTNIAPAADGRMDWWRGARFGMFIHWGLYAIPAGEWKNSKDHAEWILTTAQIPVAEYEKFKEQFNPTSFDAVEWVAMAKCAGMKYIVITSKHHDGFALFDSKVSDYDVMATPFKRDILKELSDACRRQGMTMCWYHSIMDWHHPDYLPRREWESRPAAGADFDRYVTYLRAQVTELLTNYGDIGVMWFDGEWENTWSHKYGKALYELCRKLQPRVIVNNRVDVGRGGMAGMTSEGEYAGDFGTPEQEIPSTGMAGLDWETCMTMNDHWGYNRADINFKSTEDLIRKLCDIASKGGNFLLNVGPTAEGKIPETSVARLREIGDWMRVNGESIYNTSASPFPQLGFGRCTMKRDGAKTILYFHVFDWPRDGMLMIPGIGNKPIGARVVGAAEALQVERVDSDLRIRVPGSAPSKICSVVALEVEGAPIVYVAPEIAAPSDQFVDSIEVALKVPTQQLQVRYSLDGTDPAHGAWIYEKPVVVSKTSTLKARAFHDGKAVSGISEMRLEKVEPAKAREIAPAALNPGVVSERFDGDWSRVPDFTKLTAASKVVAPAPRIEAGDGERMARRIVGFVVAPADDVYRFALESDDGSKLYINDVLIVDNDGLHPMDTKFGRAALARGLHSIRVEYFNKTGGKGLSVKWARLGAQLEALTDESLKHEIAAER